MQECREPVSTRLGDTRVRLRRESMRVMDLRMKLTRVVIKLACARAKQACAWAQLACRPPCFAHEGPSFVGPTVSLVALLASFIPARVKLTGEVRKLERPGSPLIPELPSFVGARGSLVGVR
jgi:CelD/BcsL family acetyltransferase involved in cellulose biosynthesis